MTATQLNTELFRAMSEIADDEGLMMKLLKYAKKLAAESWPHTDDEGEAFYPRGWGEERTVTAYGHYDDK